MDIFVGVGVSLADLKIEIKTLVNFREFMFYLSTPKVSATNPKCVVKTEVVCDNSPPEIKFSFIDSVKGKLFSIFEFKERGL